MQYNTNSFIVNQDANITEILLKVALNIIKQTKTNKQEYLKKTALLLFPFLAKYLQMQRQQMVCIWK
jgi:hypothetical protein